MNDNLTKNTVLLSIGTLLTKGINFMMIPLFSSWLTTADYGTFDLLVTYVTLLVPFISLSNSEAIFRFSIDSDDKEKRKYISVGACISVLNTFIISMVLLLFLTLSNWNLAFPFFALLLSEMILNHFQGVARALKKLQIYAIASVISTIGIALAVTMLVFVLHQGLSGIIYGYALGYFIGELYIFAKVRYWNLFSWCSLSSETMKAMIKYAYPLVPNNICWWIIDASDRTFINLLLGATSNGLYAIACKIPNFCSSVCNMFIISWQEAAIDALEIEQRNKYYNYIFNKTISVMVSLCAGTLSLNYFCFNYLFSDRYYDAYHYVPILITSLFFSTLTQFLGGINIGLKRTKENGVTTIIGAAVNILVDVFLILKVGIYAAAISTIVSNFVMFIIRLHRLSNEVIFKISKENILYALYYIYMLVMSYKMNCLYISFINLLAAVVMFILINRTFIFSFLKKNNIMT